MRDPWRLLDRVDEAATRRPLAARLLANASWLMVERSVVLALALVFNAWLVRHLGPAAFGRYAYALSLAGMFSALAGLGMDSVLVRELALAPREDGRILGTAMALRVVAGVLVWGAAVLAALLLRDDAGTRAAVALAAAASIFVALNVFEPWFQARIAARGLVTTRTAVTASGHLARGGLILAGSGVEAFAALFAATSAATTGALGWLYAHGRDAGGRLVWSGPWARKLLADSWVMVLVTAGIAVYMKIDQVMLSRMVGDEATGIYAPAVTLSEVWYFIPTAVSASAFPVIVQSLSSRSAEETNRKLQEFYDWMAALAYAITLALWASADWIVPLLYGPEYGETATVLKIHGASLVFVSLGIARGRYLIAKGLLGFTLTATLLGAVLNVVLNLWLLPSMGPRGAAWSTLVSYAAANYLSGLLWPPLWQQTGLMTKALLLPLRLPALLRSRRR